MYKAPYPTYIINLKRRTDRLLHIENEFKGRDEFAVNLVEAIEDQNGAIGLWETIRSIFLRLNDEKFIILCEDDHQFTDTYTPELLTQYIDEAEQRDADFLIGGVSWFNEAIQLSESLFSVQTFSGTQFVVIFRKFYHVIRGADFGPNDSADYKIAALSVNKFVIYPFISTQKEFGYSDATAKNNQYGRVTAIFNSSLQRLNLLDKIWRYRQKVEENLKASPVSTIHTRTISTYVFNVEGNLLGTKNIVKQFEDKPEFDTTIVEIEKRDIKSLGFGYFLQKLIKLAIKNDKDFILLCDATHQFTSEYSKEYLWENISHAEKLGAKIISGGTNQFGSAVAFAETLYWIDWITNVQFIIITKSAFEEILSLSNIRKTPLARIYNIVSSNKVMFYPFISQASILTTSDGEFTSQQLARNDADIFADTYNRLNFIRNEYKRYYQRYDGHFYR